MTPTLEKLPNYNRLKSTDLKALLEEKRHVCVTLVTAARTNTSRQHCCAVCSRHHSRRCTRLAAPCGWSPPARSSAAVLFCVIVCLRCLWAAWDSSSLCHRCVDTVAVLDHNDLPLLLFLNIWVASSGGLL